MVLLNNFFTFSAANLFDVNLINASSLAELALRFLFNFLVIIIIVRYLYFTVARRKDYMFTYILISTTVFILAYLLESVTLQLGFALGLFAIFGILRYRTNTIPIKEMTYLFVVIGVSIVNALSNSSISLLELLFANAAMIIITWGLESFWLKKHESSKSIVYNDLELIKPRNMPTLIRDLSDKTGLRVTRIEVGVIDYTKNSVKLKIFFEPEDNNQYMDENSNTSPSFKED